ncbi:MAG: hypothetical protein GY913_25650 [Proteobacteria bacterium]|nr:hypothetical protein [Pseudomonadota bacterium]MCP4920300.1 hypothetical protein [Pseudomonadota bacterium]
MWLRWSLAGALELELDFAHLRHAHSHLGYYGLLFPLAWIGWAAAGVRVPGRLAMGGYAACVVVTCVGFAVDGYGAVAIAGSTAVAVSWLASGFRVVGRMRGLSDPLGVVPLGIVLSLACVPPIALNLRTNPELAHGFVATFLSGLLLVVVIPSTLAGRKVSVGPWPAFLLAGALGAASLGVSTGLVTRLGLAVYAGMMLGPILSSRLELHARATWALVAVGLGAMATGVLPNTRPVALGATHFLILGPVLATAAPLWLRRPPPGWVWCIGHVLWGGMSGALVLQAFGAGAWTYTAAAIGGTGTLIWWAVVLIQQAGQRAS